MSALIAGTEEGINAAKTVRAMVASGACAASGFSRRWKRNVMQAGLQGEALAQLTMEKVSKSVPAAQDACLKKLDMSKEVRPALAVVACAPLTQCLRCNGVSVGQLFQACLKKFMPDKRVQQKVNEAQQAAFQLVKDSSPSISDEQLM